jgi:RimJ/RimL family protein N-acetyltransferase
MNFFNTEMKKQFKGKNTILRSVTEEDAAAIIEMRNNPSINRFLSSSKPLTLEDQLIWLRKNLEATDQHYFMVLNLNEIPVGTISIYNIKNGSGEFGRYVCTQTVQAVESERMILQIAFEGIGLKYLYCRTAESNVAVWRQHLRFGFTDCGNEFDDQLNFDLHVQGITKEAYQGFNYTKIDQLIARFAG